jgi:AcrR family transcriptional regulator
MRVRNIGAIALDMETRRAKAMNGRRELILNTAARLLIDAPETFSMRNLAEAAALSVRTVYNLVGDQLQVLTAVANRPARVLLQQVKRDRGGAAFDSLILEAELVERMDLAGEDGLAAVRALQRIDPAAIALSVRSTTEAEITPDLALAVEEGDLRADVPMAVLVENYVALVTQAVIDWSIDADSTRYRRRVVQALAATLLTAAAEPNRGRCIEILRRCIDRTAAPTPE